MSTTNFDNTEPIKKNPEDKRPSEHPGDTWVTPVDPQAETIAIKKYSVQTQSDNSPSIEETVKISRSGIHQQEDLPGETMKITRADISQQVDLPTDTPAVETDDVPAAAIENAEAISAGQPETDLQDTAIAAPPDGNAPEARNESAEVPNKPRRGKWIMLGVLIMLLITLAGAGVGYATGMRSRQIEQENQVLLRATTQFELGQVDLREGRLETAQDRFEYVLSIYPDFPGIDEKLVEVGLAIAQAENAVTVSTPELEPTPYAAITPVPTKNTRSVTLLFNQANEQMLGQDWDGLFSTLSAMREIDPEYKAVKVDGMLYLALRNRGIRQIQAGQLEPGMYSFAVAEQIAPIDADAESYRTWARFYLNAGSHWGIDWYRAMEGFAYLYPLVPQLRDSSGITVTQRYSRALIGYGDTLQLSSDYCGAVPIYSQAAGIYADPTLSGKIAQAEEYCANPPEVPTPTLDPLAPAPTETPEP